MKILHIVHAYSPAIGGTEFLVQQVSEYLANRAGEEVTVFTTYAYNTALFTDPNAPALPPEQGDETINGVRVRRFPVNNRWGKLLRLLQGVFFRLRLPGSGIIRMLFYGPLSPALKKAIRESDADIIVAAPFPLNHTNYVFKNKYKKPVVIIGCVHTEDKHGFSNPRIVKNVRKAAGYVALTYHEKEHILREWGIPDEKVCVIGVGIDTQPVPPGPQTLKERLNIPNDAPVIAFVGQHGLHKGIETLVLAMSTVWKQFPHVRVVIAGGTSPFSHAFKELARLFDTGEKRIFFLDNIDEQLKSDILSGCDIFATPSGFESFGITILEAWKRKRPVVACRIPATMNLIREYRTGLLVDYKNAGELAQAFLELLEDPELRKKLGQKGYDKLIKKYSFEVVGEKFHQFYREVIQRGD